ncbi:MAG: Fe-S cluster assembly protein SufD [Marinoscillum sp.]
MSEVINIEESIISRFNSWIDQHYPSDSALKSLKKSAIDKFEELGLPSRKSEAYKYTPITKILEKNFDFQTSLSSPEWTKSECESNFYTETDANHLVFINGEFIEDYSKIVSASSDLTIRLLDDHAFTEIPELKENLGKVNGTSIDPFANLSLAFFNQGLYIKASRNSDNKNTYIYQFIDGTNFSPISFPRIFIKGDSGSRTRVYEKTYIKGEEKSLNISIVESVVDANAEVRFTKLQQYLTSTYSIEGIYAQQSKDSRFYTNTFSFKGAVIRNNVYINIDAENCEGHMNGLYQISGKTHVDNNTSVDHLKPHSYSNELYKGILDENAKGVFNGKIYVRPDAQKTNAFQSNNNILLSDTATINTKPQLEIWADDVQCSHGCTTGQLDKEAIFYLRSRGIEKTRAKALLLNAFANEALVELQNDLVKEEVEGIILNKLG